MPPKKHKKNKKGGKKKGKHRRASKSKLGDGGEGGGEKEAGDRLDLGEDPGKDEVLGNGSRAGNGVPTTVAAQRSRLSRALADAICSFSVCVLCQARDITLALDGLGDERDAIVL